MCPLAKIGLTLGSSPLSSSSGHKTLYPRCLIKLFSVALGNPGQPCFTHIMRVETHVKQRSSTVRTLPNGITDHYTPCPPPMLCHAGCSAVVALYSCTYLLFSFDCGLVH